MASSAAGETRLPLGDFVQRPRADPGATPVPLTGIGTSSTSARARGARTSRTPTAASSASASTCPTPTPVAEVSSAKKLAVTSEPKLRGEAGGEVLCWGDSVSDRQGRYGRMRLAGEQGVDVVAIRPHRRSWSAPRATCIRGAIDAIMLGRDTSLRVGSHAGRVEGMPPVLQVVTSKRHVCAVTTDGRLFAGATATNGASASARSGTASSPTEVLFTGPPHGQRRVAVALDALVRTHDATAALTCWGRRTPGDARVRRHTRRVHARRRSPARRSAWLPSPSGPARRCILATDGSVQCWGDNSYGQLGIGTREAQRHSCPPRGLSVKREQRQQELVHESLRPMDTLRSGRSVAFVACLHRRERLRDEGRQEFEIDAGASKPQRPDMLAANAARATCTAVVDDCTEAVLETVPGRAAVVPTASASRRARALRPRRVDRLLVLRDPAGHAARTARLLLGRVRREHVEHAGDGDGGATAALRSTSRRASIARSSRRRTRSLYERIEGAIPAAASSASSSSRRGKRA